MKCLALDPKIVTIRVIRKGWRGKGRRGEEETMKMRRGGLPDILTVTVTVTVEGIDRGLPTERIKKDTVLLHIGVAERVNHIDLLTVIHDIIDTIRTIPITTNRGGGVREEKEKIRNVAVTKTRIDHETKRERAQNHAKKEKTTTLNKAKQQHQ